MTEEPESGDTTIETKTITSDTHKITPVKAIAAGIVSLAIILGSTYLISQDNKKYVNQNPKPAISYVVKSGDGFSSIAYNLNMPSTEKNVDFIMDTYKEQTNRDTLLPGYKATLTTSGNIVWKR
jgi:hydroxyethylthiazole kinase-like sugar kinase family protein